MLFDYPYRLIFSPQLSPKIGGFFIGNTSQFFFSTLQKRRFLFINNIFAIISSFLQG